MQITDTKDDISWDEAEEVLHEHYIYDEQIKLFSLEKKRRGLKLCEKAMGRNCFRWISGYIIYSIYIY